MKALILISLLSFLAYSNSAHAAVAYDGTGDGHTITDPNVGSTTATVCLWFKAAYFHDAESIVHYGNGADASDGRGWVIETHNVDATHGYVRMTMFTLTYGNTIESPSLDISTWYHLCFVGQGSPDSLVYVDATDATADATSNTDPYVIQNSTDDFIVGLTIPDRTAAGAQDSYATIAHVGYWNIALTGAQVASMADKSTCPTAVQAANLKVFMPLNAIGSGTEGSSNGFTYTESGNPTTDAGPGGLPCASSPTILLNRNKFNAGFDRYEY